MIGNVGFRRQVQHFFPDPERDPAHQAFQLVELLEPGDLLVLVAAHHGVCLPEGAEGRSENRNIEEPEDGVDVHRAVRHRRPGERDPVRGMHPKPLKTQRGLAAGGFDPVRFVGNDQIPSDLFRPGCKRLSPYAVVVDYRDEGHAARVRQAHPLLCQLAFFLDRAGVLVERDNDDIDAHVPFDLSDPNLNHAERARDHHAARPQEE